MTPGGKVLFGLALLGAATTGCSSADTSSRGQALGGAAGTSDGGGSGNAGSGGAHTGGTTVTGSGGAGVSGRPGTGGRGETGGGPGTADASFGCLYDGTQYGGGETFPSMDGCNTCTCTMAGVACTKRACIPDAGAGDGPTCTDTPVARLCVRGTAGSTSETIAVGDNLKIQVYPRGCLSSSCTRVDVQTCSVLGDSGFTAEGHFCLGDASFPGGGCTADCNGGGFANCESTATLTAGQHTVTLGTLSVTFTVPGTVPFGGDCDGQQF